VALLLIPSIPRWVGDPSEDALLILTVPVAVALLIAYVLITVRNLRIHREAERGEPHHLAWSLRKSIAWLAVATMATALVSEILVHSLEDFGHAVGLDEFFIAAVIVAIVGNAAEHGGAVVIAHRGNTELATEIAVTSGMQVAVFVVPAVALISLVMSHHLTLAFRPVEITTMALAAGLAWLVTRDGRSRRWEGFLLAGAYVAVVVVYFLS
jgi:Ca2+:H+ antiporter